MLRRYIGRFLSRRPPIPKDEDPTNVNNWRPIIISSKLVKVMHRVLAGCLSSMSLHDYQNGFCKIKGVLLNNIIYNLKNHDRFCYLLHKGESGVTSNEFATIIYKFLRSRTNVHPGEEIILWSDGCFYQKFCQYYVAFGILTRTKIVTFLR